MVYYWFINAKLGFSCPYSLVFEKILPTNECINCTQTYLVPKLARGQNRTTFDPKNSAFELVENGVTPKLQF
jgi:hypothetical protein